MSPSRPFDPSPLPWIACDLGDYGDYDGNCRVILADDKRIAVVLGKTDQDASNAAVIAAAHDLLAAGQSSLQHVEAALGAEHPACVALRAAIEKATTIQEPEEDEDQDPVGDEAEDLEDASAWCSSFADTFIALREGAGDRRWVEGLAATLYDLDPFRHPIEAAEAAFITLGFELGASDVPPLEERH